MKLQNSGEDDLANRLINGADVFINKVPAVTVEENNSGWYACFHNEVHAICSERLTVSEIHNCLFYNNFLCIYCCMYT